MTAFSDWKPGDRPLRIVAILLSPMALVCLSLGARLIVGSYLLIINPPTDQLDIGGRTFFFALCGTGLLVFAGVLGFLMRKLWKKPDLNPTRTTT